MEENNSVKFALEVGGRIAELGMPPPAELPPPVLELFKEFLVGKRFMIVWDKPNYEVESHFYLVKQKGNT